MNVGQFLSILEKIKLKKSRALFAYLSLTHVKFHRSELLEDVFWGEKQGKKNADRSASVRQAVAGIRRCLPADQTVQIKNISGGYSLALDPDNSPKGNVLAQLGDELAAEYWSNELIVGLRSVVQQLESLKGIGNDLDTWLHITIASFSRQVCEAAESLLANEFTQPKRQAIAKFLLELDQANELATRFLMRGHWLTGAPQRALQLYTTLYAYLDETYDQEPQQETIALLAAIKLDPDGAQSHHQVEGPSGKVCLLLSKATYGLDAETKSLLSVLYTELMLQMNRFREWEVITQVIAVKPIAEIRMNLISFDNTYQLGLQVFQSDRSEPVWSTTILQPTSNWSNKIGLAITDIAKAISIVANGSASTEVSASVYSKWIEAQAILDDWHPAREDKALTLLENVIQQAPEFGPAHAELAGALNVRHILSPGTYQTDEVKQLALNHALTSLSLDPLDTRALRVVAWCYCHKGDFDLAEFHFEQSFTLNGNSPLTLSSCGLGFAFCGNLERASEMLAGFERYHQGQSQFHSIYMAAINYLLGNYKQAIALCSVGDNAMPVAGAWMTLSFAALKDFESAHFHWRKYRSHLSDFWSRPGPPSDDDILSWLSSAFPLRSNTVRRTMVDHLNQVIHFRAADSSEDA